MSPIGFEIERLHALRGIKAGLLHLKWLRDATRLEIAVCRHELALKAGFKPDQPRVPKGNPEGGQWSGDGSGNGSPRGDPKDGPPKEPEDRPQTSRERTTILKEVARRIVQTGEEVVAIARMGTWLLTYLPEMRSYNDPPKTLEELQRAASTPAAGYDIHHIVEQNKKGQFGTEAINSPENKMLVPRLKHRDITAWYQTKNPEYGGMSPRDYLEGKSWNVQRAVGLRALIDVGVLKP